jgi:hypothetical protein
MLVRKHFYTLLFAIVISLNLNFTAKAQEIPSENDEADQVMIDSIDYGENLLDSNEIYRKQFDSLSKDGEWVEAKKSDLIRDLNNLTEEDELDIYPESDEAVYIWRPYGIDSYWNPYSNGSWVFTYCGWVWASNYSWGWGPYNYGRWYCSSAYGWIWFPGNVWAPNWVTWRHYNQYVGWYPSCPRVHWRGYRNVYTNHQFAYTPRNWVFVDKKDFTKKIDKTTIVKSDVNVKILKNSQKLKAASYSDTKMPKFKYNGPDVKVVSAETGINISPTKIEVRNSTGKENSNNVKTSVRDDSRDNKVRNNEVKTNTTRTTKTKGEQNTKVPNEGNTYRKTTREKDPDSGNTTKRSKVKKNKSNMNYEPPKENIQDSNKDIDQSRDNNSGKTSTEQTGKKDIKDSNGFKRDTERSPRK